MTGKKGSNQHIYAEKHGLPKPKLSDETRKRMAEKASKQIHSDERKEKLREHAIRRKIGGVTQSRWIKYKDKTLGSSYELAVAKSLDENSITWDTGKRISYIDPFGKKRTYTPDFYLEEYDVYLDPKNDFLINNINPNLGFSDKQKIKLVEDQNSIRVIILNKTQLDWNTIKTLL